MPRVSASLVDSLREFLAAHELLGVLAERFGSGELTFSFAEAVTSGASAKKG